MKILFITHTYSLEGGGGGEVFVSNLLKELSKKHEIIVFTTEQKNFKEEKKLGIKKYKAKVLGHHAFHKWEYMLQAEKAVEIAKKHKVDLVHAQNDAFPGIIGEKVSKTLKIPLIVAVEYLSDVNVSLNMKLVYWFNKTFLPKIKFDKIVSWSEFVSKQFLQKWGIPKNKIVQIPGAIDSKMYNPKVSGKRFTQIFGQNLIVSAKPLHSTNTKGISYTVKAMKHVVKKYPDWKFVIFGAGPGKNSLEKLVEDLNLQKNVLFAGKIQNKQVPEAYSAARIVVHSFAFKATTSIALLESMSSGKAIVATDFGEIKNTLQDSGVLVKPKNPKSIARGIIKLIENSDLRKSLEKKSRKRVEKNYSIKAIAKEFDSLYKELKK